MTSYCETEDVLRLVGSLRAKFAACAADLIEGEGDLLFQDLKFRTLKREPADLNAHSTILMKALNALIAGTDLTRIRAFEVDPQYIAAAQQRFKFAAAMLAYFRKGLFDYSWTERAVKEKLHAVLPIVRPSYRSTVFTGSGLNDFTNRGFFTAKESLTYIFKITAEGSPDSFEYSTDGGLTFSSPISITGALQFISNGISVKWTAPSGHTANEYWTLAFSVEATAQKAANLCPGFEKMTSTSVPSQDAVEDWEDWASVILSALAAYKGFPLADEDPAKDLTAEQARLYGNLCNDFAASLIQIDLTIDRQGPLQLRSCAEQIRKTLNGWQEWFDNSSRTAFVNL